MPATTCDFDMLIIGAGISGIGMAAHLAMQLPGKRYAILERREAIGGTWDLFRYPGIRSDSDMHTLGYSFEPWVHERSIADGGAILDYLAQVANQRGIAGHVRLGTKVLSADWDSAAACWRVTAERGGETETLTARWLHLGTGYYDYDEPHDPGFDLAQFAGRVVHPQFWPDDLDYAGKRVVVIGSGATAVTLVPAMAKRAAHVTMLQRTPTWMASRPARDGIANALRKVLPAETAYRITRWKNVFLQDKVFKLARKRPARLKRLLTKGVRDALGDRYDPAAFTPPYDPWDQRLCLVPDGDLFAAIKAGRADVVTARIAGFEADGVRLDDGRVLPADVIVTATGLKLAIAGKIAVSEDGRPVDFAQRFYYRAAMFSNLPNLSAVFGYLNASWTLRVDLVSELVCGIIREMDRTGAAVATPVLPADARLTEDDVFDFSSGYLQRAKHLMPRSATALPWRLNQDYRADRRAARTPPLADGVLRLSAI